MNNLRRVSYERDDGHEYELYEGSLLTFLFDIPYFPPCGVFPPLHILNQFLSLGSCGGGQSPGANWEPFSISDDEYLSLVEAVEKTPLDEIRPRARYAWLKPKFDPSLDNIDVYHMWMIAACQKHRDRWKAELEALRQSR